jgi:hypothetical protein
MKRVRPRTVDIGSLKLSPEEGFVLSRVDASTTVKDLVALTGLDEGRVVDIVDRLASEGAVEVEAAPSAAPSATTSRRPTPTSALEAELLAFLAEEDLPDGPETQDAGDEPEPATEEPPASAESASASAAEQGPGSEAEEATVAEHEQRNERAYRQIYETVYHPMSRDQRMKAATEVTGSDLIALCFDADPQIIHAVLSNPHAGIEHSRTIALHHRTQIGLEGVAKRSEHLKDSLVQRRLLRNPQLPGTILGRMVGPKLMMEVYKIAIDREIPERSRLMTRDILRKKFMLASSDEKASLLFKTEGRCLLHLVDCSLDAHATQILCSKSTFTMLFIQNLARWSATPPQLLAHLLKMPTVRRNQGLRKMLLKHPNMPGDAKRNSAL